MALKKGKVTLTGHASFSNFIAPNASKLTDPNVSAQDKQITQPVTQSLTLPQKIAATRSLDKSSAGQGRGRPFVEADPVGIDREGEPTQPITGAVASENQPTVEFEEVAEPFVQGAQVRPPGQ